MNEKLAMISPYVLVFTTFNFITFLYYNIYGLIIYKRKYSKLSHSVISREEKCYLTEIKFTNVHRTWLREFYLHIRNYSVLYFVASEILCFAAMYLTVKCVLICRIALFVDIALILFSVCLLFYFRKKNKILAEQHEENIKNTLKEFYKAKNAEHEQ